MTNANDKIDNLKSMRDKLDSDFSVKLFRLHVVHQDHNKNYDDTIYDDTVLDTIDQLKNIALRIRNIDYTIDMYKSQNN